MDKQQHAIGTPTTSYKEIKIGHTIFRVTCVFSGEKELSKTLEQLAVRQALAASTVVSAKG